MEIMMSITIRPLYPHWKSHQYPLCKMPGGPQNLYGRFRERKISYLCRESNLESLVIWPVTVLPYWLLVCLSYPFLWFIMLTISWGTGNKVWLYGSLSPVVILVAQCSESVETLLAHFLTGPPYASCTVYRKVSLDVMRCVEPRILLQNHINASKPEKQWKYLLSSINACRFPKNVEFCMIWGLHTVVDEEMTVLRNITLC